MEDRLAERRVAALEDQVRRLKAQLAVVVGIGGCAVCAAFLSPTAPADVVAARQFVVLDENGVTRGVFGMQEEESPVRLEKATLQVRRTLVALRLVEPDAGSEAVLELNHYDDPRLRLIGPRHGGNEAELGASSLDILHESDGLEGSVSLEAFGFHFQGAFQETEASEPRYSTATLELDEDEGPSIELEDEGREPLLLKP